MIKRAKENTSTFAVRIDKELINLIYKRAKEENLPIGSYVELIIKTWFGGSNEKI